MAKAAKQQVGMPGIGQDREAGRRSTHGLHRSGCTLAAHEQRASPKKETQGSIENVWLRRGHNNAATSTQLAGKTQQKDRGKIVGTWLKGTSKLAV
jgi:hypothetical protein